LKTGLPSALSAVIYGLAIALCFVPFLFLGFKKVRQVNTYKALGVYWLLNGLVNLPRVTSIQQASLRNFFTRFSDWYDLADAPLMLLVLALASSGMLRKQLLLVLSGLVAGEAVFLLVKGYTYCWPVIICAGVLLVLVYSVIGLWQFFKQMEHDRFENSMAFVYAALIFAYGTYLIIFWLSYLPKGANGYDVQDSYLMYYISLALAAVLTCAGIWSYGLRSRSRRKAGKADSFRPRYSSSSS
jgi:hypothetical protein